MMNTRYNNNYVGYCFVFVLVFQRIYGPLGTEKRVRLSQNGLLKREIISIDIGTLMGTRV